MQPLGRFLMSQLWGARCRERPALQVAYGEVDVLRKLLRPTGFSYCHIYPVMCHPSSEPDTAGCLLRQEARSSCSIFLAFVSEVLRALRLRAQDRMSESCRFWPGWTESVALGSAKGSGAHSTGHRISPKARCSPFTFCASLEGGMHEAASGGKGRFAGSSCSVAQWFAGLAEANHFGMPWKARTGNKKQHTALHLAAMNKAGRVIGRWVINVVGPQASVLSVTTIEVVEPGFTRKFEKPCRQT